MKNLIYTCSTGTLTVPEQFAQENEVTVLTVDYTGTGTSGWSKGAQSSPLWSRRVSSFIRDCR